MPKRSKKAPQLTPAEEKLKYLYKQAYSQFWNNIKFTRGWVKPVFTFEEVSHLIDLAAQISAHIRAVIDQEHPSAHPVVLGGSSREYLWSLDSHPKDFPQQFVRDLVHHTFKDCSGYYPGLTEKRIDQFIDRFLHNTTIPAAPIESPDEAVATLKEKWEYTNKLIQQFLSESDTVHKQELIRRIKKVGQALHVINLEIEEWLGKTPQASDSSDASDSEKSTEATPTSSTDESKPQEPKKEESKPEEKSQSDGSKKEESKSEEPKKEESKPEEPKKEESKPEEQSEKSEDKKVTLEIVRVGEEVNKITNEVKTLTDYTELLKFEDLSTRPEEAVKEIEGYQKQCLRYSELLMRDLLSLDQLQVGQEARPLRKQAVVHIQQLIDNLDSVSEKLRKQLQELKNQLAQQEAEKKKVEEEKRKQEEEKRKQEETEREAARKQKEEEERRKREERRAEANVRHVVPFGEQDSSEEEEDEQSLKKSQEALERKLQTVEQSENKWNMLKLQPKFQVQEKRDSYLISAYVPGMKEKDIHLSLSKDGTILTIEGLRMPTPEEERLMINQIRTRVPGFDPRHLDMYMLKLGAGQFGKFSESYKLRRDVDPEDISASYERGVLQVRLGKHKAAFAPNPYSAYDPFLQAPSNRRGMGRDQRFPVGFLDDPDMWW